VLLQKMRILFVAEYFYPYIHGGGEISIQLLANMLSNGGNEIHILTPNYGTKPSKDLKGIQIHRFWFVKKLARFTDQLSPSWYFNPVYILVLAIQIIRVVSAKKIQVIHAQSLFSLPSAILAGKFLGIPVVITLRDDQLLCNYGFCLTIDQYSHTCGLKSYFISDFFAYWQDKVAHKNVITFGIQLIYAIIGRARTRILQFFAKQGAVIIVSSSSQQKTFSINGFTTRVIHNLYPFSDKLPILPFPTTKTILYASKMSSGKGLDVLLSAFKKVLVELPSCELLVIGSGDKNYYEKICKKLKINKSVKFFHRKLPEEVMKIRRKILLEIVPSVYPESFGRTALESLASGIPAIVSNRGGLTDIVEEGKTGYITNPVSNDLTKAIIDGIRNNHDLRLNIREEYSLLKYKFGKKPLDDHVKLYTEVIK